MAQTIPVVGRGRPAMKDLNKYVIPLVATKWYDLGLELLDTKYESALDIIEKDSDCRDVQYCCRKMFSKWLETSDNANWDKLTEAMRSIGLNGVASKIGPLFQGEGHCWFSCVISRGST